MPRIISLISSATEIVYALGAGDWLVGRSHECDYPPQVLSLPICSTPSFPVSGTSPEIDEQVKNQLRNALSIYEVDDRQLHALQPTHILTQTQCEVCAVSLKDVERSVAAQLISRPQIVSLQPNCLADVWDDIRRIAASLSLDGEPLVSQLQANMPVVERDYRPTVACIEWLNPLMAAGNWVPELVELAGGRNLFGEAGKHSPWMNWADIQQADPDILIAMPCGFDEPRTRQEMHWVQEHPGYSELSAVRNNQVHTVDGNAYFNRPGPRLVESYQQLRAIFDLYAAGHLHHHGHQESH
jgi:iron complex transport system substrate-binding protein